MSQIYDKNHFCNISFWSKFQKDEIYYHWPCKWYTLCLIRLVLLFCIPLYYWNNVNNHQYKETKRLNTYSESIRRINLARTFWIQNIVSFLKVQGKAKQIKIVKKMLKKIIRKFNMESHEKPRAQTHLTNGK